jgi:hypothetical protein
MATVTLHESDWAAHFPNYSAPILLVAEILFDDMAAETKHKSRFKAFDPDACDASSRPFRPI